MAQKHPENCDCKQCKEAGQKAATMAAHDKSMPSGSSNHPGGHYRKDKKDKKVVKESTELVNFIKAMTEKNFAEANKYLHVAVESKIKTRIQQCADIKPF